MVVRLNFGAYVQGYSLAVRGFQGRHFFAYQKFAVCITTHCLAVIISEIFDGFRPGVAQTVQRLQILLRPPFTEVSDSPPSRGSEDDTVKQTPFFHDWRRLDLEMRESLKFCLFLLLLLLVVVVVVGGGGGGGCCCCCWWWWWWLLLLLLAFLKKNWGKNTKNQRHVTCY